ncbi:MAG TPA: ferritin-like domain-containing protein, partial [Mucilaginibacter sp.]|nr:ferritin-like domain-containing protein [Mucilaginibacter sp.]
ENNNDSQGYMKELLSDHESIIKFLRGNINSFAEKFNDQGSSDYLTQLLETHEGMAWMLRSHFGEVNISSRR